MDLTGWQSFICIRIFFLYIYIHLWIHTYEHIRFTSCDSRRLFLRPAVCIWTPLSDFSRTERPITFHLPGCDFGGIFLEPAGCIRTHSAVILMTRGPHFETHELLVNTSLELRARPAEPVRHFGSLSGKSSETNHKWKSNWSSKWDVLQYIFEIFFALWVLLQELGGDRFLGVRFAMSCGSSESGIWI